MLDRLTELLFDFAFFYPLLMSYLWMSGALVYYYRYERGRRYTVPPELPEYPLVSVLVPCYNESSNAIETFTALADMHYPNYEILAINDGSSDDTGQQLEMLARTIPRMRVVQLATNQGKAVALKTGATAARGEFLVCIDGDAILDHYAVTWIMSHFVHSPRVGAVTGNPCIRTRSTLLGRIQVGEFSAIVGLLKRAQRIYGRIFTISGVIGAFRRRALHSIGYWNELTITEDIDVSWRLQLAHWDIRFEPHALCWILMPETLGGLFKQRLRWAVGGAEAFKNYCRYLFSWKERRFWGIFIEYIASIVWSYTLLALMLTGIFKLFVDFPASSAEPFFASPYTGLVLGLTCLLQFAVCFFMARKYDSNLGGIYLEIIWYPLFYWLLNWIVSLIAFPKAMFFSGGKKRGRWHTTDRGIGSEPDKNTLLRQNDESNEKGKTKW